MLASVSADDMSNEAFPYLTARNIAIGDASVRALRVTYVGELGWELYTPTEFGAGLWDTLWQAGQGHGVVAGGYRAIDSLRLEKGYRVWSSDITPEDSPDQAGLGFAVRVNKAVPFIGREALIAAREAGLDRRLCCLVLDEPLAVALGNEPIRIGDAVVGRVTSGGYGFTVGASIAYGYLPVELAVAGTRGEVEVFGEWIEGIVAAEPLWDPKGERVRS